MLKRIKQKIEKPDLFTVIVVVLGSFTFANWAAEFVSRPNSVGLVLMAASGAVFCFFNMLRVIARYVYEITQNSNQKSNQKSNQNSNQNS